MHTSIPVLTMALATIPWVTTEAWAQRALCGDGAGLIAHLEKEWGEDPTVVALDAAGRMVRLLANPQTGTWSMLMTGPGEPTCLIHHGSAWQQTAQPIEPGDPS